MLFDVKFDDKVSLEKLKGIAKIFQQLKTNSINTMDCYDESYLLDDYNLNEENSNPDGGRSNKHDKEENEYEEESGYGSKVNCASQ